MTDIPSGLMSVPSRLGASARLDDGELVVDLESQPATLHHGVLRASAVSFAIDAVAGILIDQDPGAWSFTTDMSVRMLPIAAPKRVTARNTVLREGRRSVTCKVELRDQDDALIGRGAIGFARVARKESDPPKLTLTPEEAPLVFRDLGFLDAPVRDEAGIEVLDAAAGVLQMEVTPEVRNPAGTLQGAMVALLVEAAAEDLAAARADGPVVVTELDLRYIAKAEAGSVRTRANPLGDGPDAPIEVELVDTATGAVTTLAYARAVELRAEPGY